MARNRRVNYAVQAISAKGDGAASYTNLHGVTSFSKTTSFELSQIFELGQLEIYENIEGVPNVEGSISKTLDGHPLIYSSLTVDAVTPTLIARTATKGLIGVSIYPDTNTAATGIGTSECEISGVVITSLNYSIPVEGEASEQVGFQANNIVWANDTRIVNTEYWNGAKTLNITGSFTGTDAPIGSGGASRRENVKFDHSPAFGVDSKGYVKDPDCTVLPSIIEGISSSGTNELVSGDYQASIQSISVSTSLSREDIFQLGRKTPYYRPANFPTEVTLEVTTIASSGDMVSGTEYGILTASNAASCSDGGNISDSACRIALCEGTRIWLGNRLKLASVNQSGGDSGGGNVQLTYTFTGFNTMTVLHSGESTFWSSRLSYLNE